LKVTSAAACCEVCRAIPGGACKAWTWNGGDPAAGGNQYCYAKRSCRGREASRFAVSGFEEAPTPTAAMPLTFGWSDVFVPAEA
jgi:hypothetical protein